MHNFQPFGPRGWTLMYSLGKETSWYHFSREFPSPFRPQLVEVKPYTSKRLRADVDIDREYFPYIQGSQIRTSFLGVFNCISK